MPASRAMASALASGSPAPPPRPGAPRGGEGGGGGAAQPLSLATAPHLERRCVSPPRNSRSAILHVDRSLPAERPAVLPFVVVAVDARAEGFPPPRVVLLPC